METIKEIYLPIGHVVKNQEKKLMLKRWLKNHPLSITIFSSALVLLLVYTVLMFQFIQLMKILNNSL